MNHLSRILAVSAATALMFVFCISTGSAQSRSSTGNWVIGSSTGQGRLGVSIQDVTKELKDRRHLSVDEGAYVTSVEEESPADKADIREGDVIVKFGSDKVEDTGDLMRAVRKAKPKTEVTIEVVRKGEHKVLTATITRPRGSTSYSYSFGNRPFTTLPRIPHSLHAFSMSEFQGLQVEEMTKQLAEYFEVPGNKGVLVTEVESGSPAEKAGFKAGDIVMKAGGNTVRRIDDLREELSDRTDSGVAVDVLRKGKPVTLTLKPEAEDDSERDEDDTSLRLDLERLHEATAAHAHDYHEMAQRTVRAIREAVRRVQSELREELQGIRRDVRNRLRTM